MINSDILLLLSSVSLSGNITLYEFSETKSAVEPFHFKNQEKLDDILDLAPQSNPFFIEEIKRDYIEIYSDFKSKWQNRIRRFDGFEEQFVFDNVKRMIDKLVKLVPHYVTFELTDDCSIFFQSSIGDNNVYLELFFAKELDDKVEAITNIYKDGKSIFAYGGSIEDVFGKISSKVKDVLPTIEPTQKNYVLSRAAFAQATL